MNYQNSPSSTNSQSFENSSDITGGAAIETASSHQNQYSPAEIVFEGIHLALAEKEQKLMASDLS